MKNFVSVAGEVAVYDFSCLEGALTAHLGIENLIRNLPQACEVVEIRVRGAIYCRLRAVDSSLSDTLYTTIAYSVSDREADCRQKHEDLREQN